MNSDAEVILDSLKVTYSRSLMDDLQKLLDDFGGLTKLKEKVKGFSKREFMEYYHDYKGGGVSVKSFNFIWDKVLTSSKKSVTILTLHNTLKNKT